MQDIEQLYRNYFQTVFKYLFCMTHNADLSEELTQETFYQALKTYKNFRGESKVSVWLCQIAKNVRFKEYNKRKRENENSITDFNDTFTVKEHVEADVLARESKIALYQGIQNLNEVTREVMYLRLTGELSFHEIGEILDRNETWARVTFYRGKQKLAKEMHEWRMD